MGNMFVLRIWIAFSDHLKLICFVLLLLTVIENLPTWIYDSPCLTFKDL